MVKKKVLFFRPSLAQGGADRVTATLLRRLDRARFEVSIALVSAEGPFMQDLPADVTVHRLESRRLALSVPALRRLIRRIEPDVVFSTASAANVIAVIAHGLARSRSRLVLSERSALFRGRANDAKQKIEVALKRVTYRRADVVTVVSNGLGNQLVTNLSLPRDLVRVVYNPIVEEDLADRIAEPVDHPWFAPGAVPVIVACARLVIQKDYPSLLAAFSKVRAARNVRLFILGEGALRSSLEALAQKIGIANDVCFFGFDKNPLKYMARAQILMHASNTEGLPGSLIQAMACGTPVISTDCDYGPREVISSNVDGFLVPVGDVDALAERAIRLLGDDELRATMGARARESSARFSVESSLKRYAAALEA